MTQSATGLPLADGGAAPSLGVALFLLTKPGIVAAVTLSAFAGMVLPQGSPPPQAALPSLLGVTCAATGSALLNNVLDRRIDLLMERVRKRTIALAALGSGRVVAAALLLILVGLALVSASGAAATLLLLAAVLSYTVHYTLVLKRRSHWAALLGGLPGALPVLVGQAAVGPLDLAGLLLFLIMLIWQPPHFWILSLLHREEYSRAGIPVLPLVKGERVTRRLTLLALALLGAASLLLWLYGPCSSAYGIAALGSGLTLLGGCALLLERGRYRPAFTCTIVYLVVLLAALIADRCFSVGS